MAIRTKEFYEFQNKVMENLEGTELFPRESKFCWTLYRDTCGYGNYKVEYKRDWFAERTRILKTHVSDVKRRLKERNIIIENHKYIGFNPKFNEWEKVPRLGLFKKVPRLGPKSPEVGYKNGPEVGTLRTNKKENSKEGRDFYMELSRKEIEKLESDQWYRAVMWNYGKFGMDYIEKTIKEYDYDTRMSCWYIYEDSGNIRNKEAFFSHLLRNYQEEEKL